MLFGDSYYSIEAPAEGVFRDRGSRFLAFASPVKDEKEIKTFLLSLKEAHPSAVRTNYTIAPMMMENHPVAQENQFSDKFRAKI